MNKRERSIWEFIIKTNNGYDLSQTDLRVLNKLSTSLAKSELSQEEIEWVINAFWGMGLAFGWDNPYKVLYPKENNNG